MVAFESSSKGNPSSSKGGKNWRGKGDEKGKGRKGKWKPKTALHRREELEDWICYGSQNSHYTPPSDPEQQIIADSKVAQFLRQCLGPNAATPLAVDGELYFRGKSLVSIVIPRVPLKTAKQARQKLPSASQGGMRSCVFFEKPTVGKKRLAQAVDKDNSDADADSQAEKTAKDPSSGVEEESTANTESTPPIPDSFDARTSTPVVILSSQHETIHSVHDVVEEAKRLHDCVGPLPAALSTSAPDSDAADSESDVQIPVFLVPEAERMLANEMCMQRELNAKFEELLRGLPFWKKEKDECLRRGLLPQVAENVCLFRTWKGGPLRGVPIVIREKSSKTGGTEADDSAEADKSTACIPFVETIDVGLPPGLLVPARNVEGLITGLQLRTRTDTEEEEKKQKNEQEKQTEENKRTKRAKRYMWVSRNKSIKGGTDFLPFFCVCVRWSCRTHTVALVEGSLKAYAFAFLARRLPVIGAAGGQWHQCGEALLHALARLNAREVLIFVDAGAVVNRSVLLDYFRSLKVLQLEWGVDVRFVWWEQIEKTGLDCDDQLLALRRENQTQNQKQTKIGSPADDSESFSEALKLTAADFWLKIPEDLRERLSTEDRSKQLVAALQCLLEPDACPNYLAVANKKR